VANVVILRLDFLFDLNARVQRRIVKIVVRVVQADNKSSKADR
jgi:hypothetical protein